MADTQAQSYLQLTVQAPGAAAEAAAERKTRKYESISLTHHFAPVAFESLGPICSAGLDLIGEVGNRINTQTHDSRKRTFLFQRLSIALQRGNAAILHSTFAGCLQLLEILEILEIYWNFKPLLEILEIYWNFVLSTGNS